MAFDISTATPVEGSGGFDLSTAREPDAPPQPDYLQNALGILDRIGRGALSAGPLESALHVGTSAAAGLGGGLSYLGTLAASGGDTDAAKAVQEDTQRALTYQPRTEAGKGIATAADKALGLIPEGLNKAGEMTADATGSPLLGAAVNTGGNALLQALGIRGLRGAGRAATAVEDAGAVAPRPAPTTPAELLQQSLDNGKNVGYQATPNYDPQSTTLERWGQGIAGQAQIEKAARVQNQGVTNALGARAIGMDPAALVTHDVLRNVRQTAFDNGYAPIADLERDIPVDAQFLKGVAATKAGHASELGGNPDVLATADYLLDSKSRTAGRPAAGSRGDTLDPLTLQQKGLSFQPAEILDYIQTLRDRASDAYAAQRGSAGAAFKKQAGELEALLDRHLQDAEDLPAGTLNNYRAARQLIAKTHNIGDNLNPSTGNVDAAGLARMLADGEPLTGDLKTIGDFANAAPGLATVPHGVPLPTSPLNTAAGAAAAHVTGGASLALIPAARLAAAKWLIRRNENPARLQPLDKTLGQAALDAVHGNAAAFAKMYGQTAPVSLAQSDNH